ncbi:prealbumin-like fold domain-containing protein [Kitasatospora sp. NPDC001664]
MTPLHGAALRCAAAALAAVASLGADPAAAAPRATGDLKLTLVARVCASYSDVMANRQRDDNMQSLQNLGKDSVYSEGQPVAPDVEAANDPNCTPLTGWRFSLGSGIGGEVQGLSTVTPAPDGLTRATTLASVPELDANRNDTGRILAGAVTVDLDDSLIAVARNRRLQIQGGAPTDPLNQQLLGNTYSFATLRCAVDNQRADNVDRAAYPTGSSHVFCYYYAVRQPAEPGTVVVRKHVLGTAAARPFAFDGDLSYNPGGLFQLTAGPGADGEQSFRRAPSAETGQPWTVQEQVPAGWTMTDLACTSANGTSTTTTSGPRASVTLAAADTVTCVYTDAPSDTVAPLTLLKQTTGGAGGPFGFTAEDGTTLGTASTTRPDTPVNVGTTYLAPGRHTVTEALPEGWSLSTVSCQGATATNSTDGFALDLPAGGATCTVTNTRQNPPPPSPTPSPSPTPTPLPTPTPTPTAVPTASPRPTEQGPALPETGATGLAGPAGAAAGLVLSGAVLVFLAARRRN